MQKVQKVERMDKVRWWYYSANLGRSGNAAKYAILVALWCKHLHEKHLQAAAYTDYLAMVTLILDWSWWHHHLKGVEVWGWRQSHGLSSMCGFAIVHRQITGIMLYTGRSQESCRTQVDHRNHIVHRQITGIISYTGRSQESYRTQADHRNHIVHRQIITHGQITGNIITGIIVHRQITGIILTFNQRGLRPLLLCRKLNRLPCQTRSSNSCIKKFPGRMLLWPNYLISTLAEATSYFVLPYIYYKKAVGFLWRVCIGVYCARSYYPCVFLIPTCVVCCNGFKAKAKCVNWCVLFPASWKQPALLFNSV